MASKGETALFSTQQEQPPNATSQQQAAAAAPADATPAPAGATAQGESKPEVVSPTDAAATARYLLAATAEFNPLHALLVAIAVAVLCWVMLAVALKFREHKRRKQLAQAPM